MKGLKQTLGKDQSKKTKKNNFTTTMTKPKKSQWNQLNSIILCKSPNKGTQNSGLENAVTSIIQNSFKNNAIVSLDKVVKEIIQKCANFKNHNNYTSLNKTVEDEELKKLEEIKVLVGEIIKKNEKNEQSNDAIQKFYQELTQIIGKKNKISKKQKLQEYDKLIRMLSPKNFPKKQKRKSRSPDLPKSNNSIKVKVTQQQFEIKRQQSPATSLRIGSEGKRVKTAGSSRSAFKSENGNDKLKKFFNKDQSIKLIKTKVQYDYSAILEASKSKIHTRNKNMTMDERYKGGSATDITSKLNKAKKNEAFVFYRPKTKMGKNQ